MVIYHFMWNRDRSERRWQIMGIALRLAQSVGLRTSVPKQVMVYYIFRRSRSFEMESFGTRYL